MKRSHFCWALIAIAFIVGQVFPLQSASAETRAGVEVLDIYQAASRIEQSKRPTVILLYGIGCSLSRNLFPDFVALAKEYQGRGVDFLVFSTDPENNIGHIPDFLSRHNAPFSPVWIKRWEPGTLSKALTAIGIDIGSSWTRPLVAVRDTQGRIVAQDQATDNLDFVRDALDEMMEEK